MKQSAGTLLFRYRGGIPEVLIVHPSGKYNLHAPWSIPKGAPDAGEELEAAARRETREETGVEPDRLSALGFVELKRSRKRIHAFAGPAPDGASPSCASWEVDRAEFVPFTMARELLHPDQAPLVDRLVSLLSGEPERRG